MGNITRNILNLLYVVDIFLSIYNQGDVEQLIEKWSARIVPYGMTFNLNNVFDKELQ